jgi:hypothetical protein
LSSPRPVPWWAAPALLFVVAAVLLTAPVWLSPGEQVLGHADSDAWKHLWGDAWFARDLGSALPVPTRADMLWAPDGGVLYNLDPLTGFVAAALSPLTGLVLAHDLAQVGAVVLGALGATLLAREVTGDPATAAIAGAVYGFSAHLQAAVFASGIGETAHVGFIPLSLWAALRVLRGERRMAIALAPFLALSAIGSWYYGMVTSLVATVVVGAALVRRLRRGDDPWAGVPALALGVAGALVLVAPFAWAFLGTFGDGQLHGVGAVGTAAEEFDPSRSFAVATVRDLFVPGHRIQDRVDLLFFSNHPGFLVPALGLLAIAAGTGSARAVGVATLLAGLLVLGPTIHLDRGIPLGPNPPFRLLQAAWPRFDMVRNIERLQVAFSLGLGVLGAQGLAWMADRWSVRGPRRTALGLGLAALVIAEGNLVSGLGAPLPTAPVAVSPVFQTIAAEPGEFGLIHLPADDTAGGRPFWHQVTHGRPLPMNLDGSPAPSLRDNALLSALMPDTAHNRHFLGLRLDAPDDETLRTEAARLSDQGFRYIVLDQGDGPQPALEALLGRCCGDPVHADPAEALQVWRLTPAE